MHSSMAADSITCRAGKICKHECGHWDYDVARIGHVLLRRVLCHLQFQVSVSPMQQLSLHHGASERMMRMRLSCLHRRPVCI